MEPQRRNSAPQAEVQSVVIYNDKDLAGWWIPMRIEKGTWITLKPSSRGAWSRDARIHGEESYAGAWKAQVIDFKWGFTIVRGSAVKHLESILVQHAYQRRQLLLDPIAEAGEPRYCNYLYSSFWEDHVPPSSVLDIILVLHHMVGEATRNGRRHRDLMENETFYLRAVYVPRSRVEIYESLEDLPLPGFSDPEWPVPDMHTSEAFRLKLATDIAAAMKGATGSRTAHVQWFMPMHVMVDLFAPARESMRCTPAMFIFKAPTGELLASLMDVGWDQKFQVGADSLKCVVSRNSLLFRYYKARQVLYATFSYVRYRLVRLQTWVEIDQAVNVEMVIVTVVLGDVVLPTFEVGKSWPVSHIRDEISILLSRDNIPEYYGLVIEKAGHPNKKINRRYEAITEIGIALPTNGRFRMVPA